MIIFEKQFSQNLILKLKRDLKSEKIETMCSISKTVSVKCWITWTFILDIQ